MYDLEWSTQQGALVHYALLWMFNVYTVYYHLHYIGYYRCNLITFCGNLLTVYQCILCFVLSKISFVTILKLDQGYTACLKCIIDFFNVFIEHIIVAFYNSLKVRYRFFCIFDMHFYLHFVYNYENRCKY